MPSSRERALVGMMILVMLSSFMICQIRYIDYLDRDLALSSEFEITQPDIDSVVFLESANSHASPTWVHTTTNPEYVRPIALSDDGSTIVEAAGNFLRVFNETSNETIWTYETDTTIFDCVVSANGSIIAIGTYSGQLILFDKSSNSPKWASNCSGFLYSIDISGNGTHIAASDQSGCIYAYSHLSNESIWKYNT
ncbi:MAG: hypothetical protein P1Q69_20985, partial [Candidatus Thorarchaeota archaeon]|nr:hypothetical protein [Candidatus Thorarchaeota archaeon]